MQESQDIPKFIAFGLPIKIKKKKKTPSTASRRVMYVV
jgi:hypothetical protein